MLETTFCDSACVPSRSLVSIVLTQLLPDRSVPEKDEFGNVKAKIKYVGDASDILVCVLTFV